LLTLASRAERGVQQLAIDVRTPPRYLSSSLNIDSMARYFHFTSIYTLQREIIRKEDAEKAEKAKPPEKIVTMLN
jgi:hypothetical protein